MVTTDKVTVTEFAPYIGKTTTDYKENDMGEPIYVETWKVVGNPKGDILDIAYTRCMCPTVEATDMFRRSMAERHNCILKGLLKTRKIEVE